MSTRLYHTPTVKRNTPTDLRLERGRQLFAGGAVRPIPSSQHAFACWVDSQTTPGLAYLTTVGPESCSCPDYRHHGEPHKCKHLWAARLAFLAAFETEQEAAR